MDESRVRAIILEEMQGILNRIIEETEGSYNQTVLAAQRVSEIVSDRLQSIETGEGSGKGQSLDADDGGGNGT